MRSNIYGEESKLVKNVIDYDANLSYLYWSDYLLSFSKGTLLVKLKTIWKKSGGGFERVLKAVLKGKIFGFAQIGVEVPDELYNKCIEIKTPSDVQGILACHIPEAMKMYNEKISR